MFQFHPQAPSPAAVVARLQKSLSPVDDAASATTPKQQNQQQHQQEEDAESVSPQLHAARDECTSSTSSASSGSSGGSGREGGVPRALYMLRPDAASLLMRGTVLAPIGDSPAVVRFFRSPMQARVVRVLQDDLRAACAERGVVVVDERTHCIGTGLFLGVTCYAAGTPLDRACAVAHMYMQNLLPARPNVFNTDIYRAGLFEYLGDVGIAGCVS